jgi:hypothetical protein
MKTVWHGKWEFENISKQKILLIIYLIAFIQYRHTIRVNRTGITEGVFRHQL